MLGSLMVTGPTVGASFLASLVECVEALTIVLAVGVVRGWRSALMGCGAAFIVLAAIVAIFGAALGKIPLVVLQVVVGGLLLLFGLRWLRKAILRSAGVIPLHDEAKAFATEQQRLGKAAKYASFDKAAFATSFQITMLEGIEVVFIVLAIGAGSPQRLKQGALGALAALVLVILAGIFVHRPLVHVPENQLKFGVGVMLSAFGTFWFGEGAGFAWPGADWSLVALVVAYFVVAIGTVGACRMVRAKAIPEAEPVQ